AAGSAGRRGPPPRRPWHGRRVLRAERRPGRLTRPTAPACSTVSPPVDRGTPPPAAGPDLKRGRAGALSGGETRGTDLDIQSPELRGPRRAGGGDRAPPGPGLPAPAPVPPASPRRRPPADTPCTLPSTCCWLTPLRHGPRSRASDPGLGVGQVVVARVLAELGLERAGRSLRAGHVGGNEHHPRVALASRDDQLGVQGTEVTDVVGHDRPPLGSRERDHLGIACGVPLGMFLERDRVVSASP